MRQSQADQLKVLVVDDDIEVTGHLEALLRDWGYQPRAAYTGRAATATYRQWNPHLALLDLQLPDIDGLELVREFCAGVPPVDTVIISGNPSMPIAVKAVESGALCFLEKPVSPWTLRSLLEQAERRHVRGTVSPPPTDGTDYQLGRLLSRSARMRDAFELVRCVAPTDANVLIIGENGTGKELVADAIHAMSGRASRPFIKVNCAAIPEELMEAELFGHRRGAFTGAIADRVGLFESAAGGTLLLDEIGEMPAHLQTKLLRVLQERQARPLGGGRPVDLDFRLVCATNSDLRGASIEGRFRQDLFFRVNTITIALPPLRERPEDIPLLTDHFLNLFSVQYEREIEAIDPGVSDRFLAHDWRGNVRELEHAIERAVIVCRHGRITVDDLPEHLQRPGAVPMPSASTGEPPVLPLAELERLAIMRALKETRGNKRAAAALLGVYRPTLYSKLRKYGLMESSGADVPERLVV